MRHPGRLRIIGGRWRRRLIPVPAAEGLRPTPDRVRETVFNWLDAHLPGARCLDLFAGSGALGFEAASRGAGRVVMIERDARVVAHLQLQARALGADAVQVVRADAAGWLAQARETFQVAFVDPPYGSVNLPALLASMEAACVLDPQCLVYVEQPVGAAGPALPAHWRCLRERRAGRVRYHLASPPAGDPRPALPIDEP